MIFAVANSKGGVGKSTLAVHLAAALASQGNTLLIDSDPQSSSADWAAWRRDRAEAEPALLANSPTTVKLTGMAVLSEGANLVRAYDHAVIDSGGHDSQGTRAAMLLAQQVIIPVGASSYDAAALGQTLGLITECRVVRPDIRLRVVLCRVGHGTNDTAQMIDFLAEQGIEPMQARIGERVSFRRAITSGQTVMETADSAQAAAEFAAFFTELIEG